MKQLHQKLSAGILGWVSPLRFSFRAPFPISTSQSRSKGVGVPRDEGPPTQARQALGSYCCFSFPSFFAVEQVQRCPLASWSVSPSDR